MLPIFPQCKVLELSDRDAINTILFPYPPHSDYNMAGLWSYDTEDKVEISLLHNNLVLKSFDYLTGECFLSFFGYHKFSETVRVLLDYAKEKNIIPELRLIPEFILKKTETPEKDFLIEEDPDNFDYIYTCDELITLSGRKFDPKRNFINRFKRNFTNVVVKNIDISDRKIANQIFELFFLWEKMKNIERKETQTELIAIERFIQAASYFHTTSLGIYVKDTMIGFSLDEIVQQQYGIIHFEKADINYTGIFQYLKQQSAVNFKKHGCVYINYEQDCGIPELRKAKRSWSPSSFLKKYRIKRKR